MPGLRTRSGRPSGVFWNVLGCHTVVQRTPEAGAEGGRAWVTERGQPELRRMPSGRAAASGARAGYQGQVQMGSLAGAAHPLKHNAGVQSGTQWGQKPHVENKGKCLVQRFLQYWNRGRKAGLTILFVLRT